MPFLPTFWPMYKRDGMDRAGPATRHMYRNVCVVSLAVVWKLFHLVFHCMTHEIHLAPFVVSDSLPQLPNLLLDLTKL